MWYLRTCFSVGLGTAGLILNSILEAFSNQNGSAILLSNGVFEQYWMQYIMEDQDKPLASAKME